MRKLLPCLLMPLILGGCQTGYLMDRLGDREAVLAPQLARFGMSAQETRCMSERLSRRLSLARLRALEIRARAVRRGLSNPARLTLNDLTIAANGLNDPEVRLELDNAASTCGLRPATLSVASAQAAAPVTAPATQSGSEAVQSGNEAVGRILSGSEAAAAFAGGAPATAGDGEGIARVLTGPQAEAAFAGRGPVPSGATPSADGAPAVTTGAVLNPLWLNLGSAGSGQAISIDGSSVDREENARTAWFRMIDPEATPSLTWYRLRVHCTDRTIQPVARRRVDAEGRELEHQIYPDDYERPTAVEGGTVTEIAWLSLCT